MLQSPLKTGCKRNNQFTRWWEEAKQEMLCLDIHVRTYTRITVLRSSKAGRRMPDLPHSLRNEPLASNATERKSWSDRAADKLEVD